MSITGQLHGDNPGYTSLQDFNKAAAEQGAREFAVWKDEGFPADKRPVTNKDGEIVLVDVKRLQFSR